MLVRTQPSTMRSKPTRENTLSGDASSRTIASSNPRVRALLAARAVTKFTTRSCFTQRWAESYCANLAGKPAASSAVT